MKTMKKKTISALLSVLVLGSSVNIGFAETPELPRGVIRIQETSDSSIPVGAYVYQDEDYEGDFINDPNFSNIEYNGTTDMGTNYVPFKVVDPKDPSNHVFTFSSVDKTSTRNPNNTGVSLYQGVLNTKNSNDVGNTSPSALGRTKGYMVFEARAYFDGKVLSDYKLPGWNSFLIASRVRGESQHTAPHYAAFISSGTTSLAANGEGRVTMDTDNWHTFKLVYNCETKHFDYIIDDKISYQSTAQNIPSVSAGMRFFVNGVLFPENIVYFDDVKTYWYCPTPGVTATFNSATDTVTVNSLTELAPFGTNNVTVSKDGAAVQDVATAVTLSDDKKTATITIDTTKIAAGGYTLSLSNVMDVFDQSLELSAPLDLTLPDAKATVSIDDALKAVRLDFSTGVTADLTSENIQVFEDGVLVSGKVSNIVTAADKSYATFTLDCSQIGKKVTTIGILGLTDKFTQTVAMADDNIVHAPSFTIEGSEIIDSNLCITFSNNVSSFTKDNITVADADGNAVANAISDITLSGKVASVVFGAGVKVNKSYTAQISGVTDEFSSTLANTTRNFSTPFADTLYQDDYTDFNVNNFNILQPWPANSGTISNIKQADDPLDSTNKVAAVYGTGKTDTSYPYTTAMTIAKTTLKDTLKNKTSKTSRTSNLICYETDMYLSTDMLSRLSTKNCSYGIYISPSTTVSGDAGRTLIFNTSIISDGTKFRMASYDTINRVEFDANTWTNLKFVVDHENLKYSIYVNDQCVLYDHPITAQCAGYIDSGCAGLIAYYKGTLASDLITEGEMYFDNTNVYEMNFKAGVKDVVSYPAQKNVVVEYNTPVTNAEINRIYVTDGTKEIENAITNRELSEDGLYATLTYSDELVSDTEYFVNFQSDAHDVLGQPISVSDNTYSFEIAKSDSVYVVDNTIESTGGANPTVSFKLNSYIDGESAWVGVGFYDEYNYLVGVACKDVTITGETNESFEIVGDCSNAQKYMIFVWDSIETMAPLQNAETINIVSQN